VLYQLIEAVWELSDAGIWTASHPMSFPFSVLLKPANCAVRPAIAPCEKKFAVERIDVQRTPTVRCVVDQVPEVMDSAEVPFPCHDEPLLNPVAVGSAIRIIAWLPMLDEGVQVMVVDAPVAVA